MIIRSDSSILQSQFFTKQQWLIENHFKEKKTKTKLAKKHVSKKATIKVFLLKRKIGAFINPKRRQHSKVNPIVIIITVSLCCKTVYFIHDIAIPHVLYFLLT